MSKVSLGKFFIQSRVEKGGQSETVGVSKVSWYTRYRDKRDQESDERRHE